MNKILTTKKIIHENYMSYLQWRGLTVNNFNSISLKDRVKYRNDYNCIPIAVEKHRS